MKTTAIKIRMTIPNNEPEHINSRSPAVNALEEMKLSVFNRTLCDLRGHVSAYYPPVLDILSPRTEYTINITGIQLPDFSTRLLRCLIRLYGYWAIGKSASIVMRYAFKNSFLNNKLGDNHDR